MTENAIVVQGLRKRFGEVVALDGIDFEVERYLHHQGESFLRRFDADTYLYLSRVMDYWDPFGDPAVVAEALRQVTTRFLVLSFDTDWRFPTAHSLDLVRNLAAHRVPVTFREIASPWGHDSFLLEVPEYHRTVRAFLRRMEDEAVGGARAAPAPGDRPAPDGRAA